MVLIGPQLSTPSTKINPRYVGYLTTLYEVQTQRVCWNDMTILGIGKLEGMERKWSWLIEKPQLILYLNIYRIHSGRFIADLTYATLDPSCLLIHKN
jgi:hypothetical protein